MKHDISSKLPRHQVWGAGLCVCFFWGGGMRVGGRRKGGWVGGGRRREGAGLGFEGLEVGEAREVAM